MADLEFETFYELKTKITAWLFQVYLTWNEAAEEFSRARVSIKETKAGHRYAYLNGVSKPASPQHLADWERRQQLRAIYVQKQNELETIAPFYRAAQLTVIDAKHATVLRELYWCKLLGRSVYVIKDLGQQAHIEHERQPGERALPTLSGLHLLIVSHEQEVLRSQSRPECADTWIEESLAGLRDASAIASTKARVNQIVNKAGAKAVFVYTKDDLPPMSLVATEILQAWGIRQWHDEDALQILIVLGKDDKPAPVIAPPLDVLTLLDQAHGIEYPVNQRIKK